MTQNASDVEIANQGFAAFRQDLNDVLEDITTLHSGNTAPTTTYANQWWYEEDTDKLYIRNEDNDAWVEILTIDQANDHLASLGATITLDGSGNASIAGDLSFGDNDKAIFGAGSDLQIYHDGSNSYIDDTGTGNLYIRATDFRMNNAANTQQLFAATDGGATQLFHAGTLRLATNSAGVETQVLSANSLKVGGNGTDIDSTISGASSVLTFKINGSEKMRVQSGGGISFNGDTAAANALDDYEEGTWTPSYTTQSGSFSSITYNEQNGTYVKIGRLVVVSFDLRTNSVSLGTASGSLYVTGLPFNINGSQGTGQCGGQIGWVTNSPEYLNIADGSNYGFLRRTDGAGYSDLTVSNLTTGSSTGANRILGCSLAYYTNS